VFSNQCSVISGVLSFKLKTKHWLTPPNECDCKNMRDYFR